MISSAAQQLADAKGIDGVNQQQERPPFANANATEGHASDADGDHH